MTKKQIRKLETIIGKLEALQNEIPNSYVRGLLGDAKTELMRALREVHR